MQSQNRFLTICPKKSQTEKHCNSCMMTSSVVSASDSSLIGDYIGMESCFDLYDNSAACGGVCDGGAGDGGVTNGVCSQSFGKRPKMSTMAKREFPPPIPSLALSDPNLPSHMPWVLKRYYTSDGRLILREERVKQHEYMRAHRSNGRLTLHLVPSDDNIDDLINDDDDDDEEEEEGKHDSSDINNATVDDENEQKSNILETLLKDNDNIPIPMIEDSLMKCSIAETPIDSTGNNNNIAANAGKCMNYSSVRASATCLLGLTVPAVRPVHT